MSILLTGATGFVGGAVYAEAQVRGVPVRPVVRTDCSAFKNHDVVVQSLAADTNWGGAFVGIDVVIHCAARVHVMKDGSDNPLVEYCKVNVDGTLNLASQAVKAGVKRFVFISSIKVNGEATQLGRAFTSEDVAAPVDAYGISKAEAEAGLRLLAQETGLEVVIIRPPLVYGPGVRGNFSSLLRWVARGWPLPFGSITRNRRSLVALDNLVDLILTCVDHPKAANQTFLVSDGEDLSMAELLQRMGKALNRPVCLLPVPAAIMSFAARLFGKTAVAQRLLGSLQVDITRTCELLGWKPSVTVDEALRVAVREQI